MLNNQRILFVTYYFPPVRCVATHRIRNLYDQALKYFEEVYVSSSTNRNKLPKEDIYVGAYKNVFENLTIDYRTFKRGETSSFGLSKTSFLGALVFKLVESFPTNIIMGEGGIIYVIASFFKIRKLVRKYNINYIFSSFRPFSDHFTVYLIKLCFPNLFWIADFRDHPINRSLKNVYCSRFQKRILSNILKKANLVLTVSNGITKNLPISGMHHLMRNAITSFPEIGNLSRYEKFTITYTGSVYSELYDPDSLLLAISNILDSNIIDRNNIQFIYAGQDSKFWIRKFSEFGILNVLNNRGYVDYVESLTIQSRSHVNLLLNYCDTQTMGDLSAKLYEYLRWSNPILVLTKGDSDIEMEEIFKRTGCGKVFTSGNYMQIRTYLIELIGHFNSGSYVLERDNQRVDDLHWDRVFSQFVLKL